MIYHIFFLEGSVRDFWHFKGKQVSDLLLLGKEVFPLPASARPFVLSVLPKTGQKLMICGLDLVCAFAPLTSTMI